MNKILKQVIKPGQLKNPMRISKGEEPVYIEYPDGETTDNLYGSSPIKKC